MFSSANWVCTANQVTPPATTMTTPAMMISSPMTRTLPRLPAAMVTPLLSGDVTCAIIPDRDTRSGRPGRTGKK